MESISNGTEKRALGNIGTKICGYPEIEIRNLIREFLDLDSGTRIEHGEFKFDPKKFSEQFVSMTLKLSEQEARQLLTCLIENEFIEAESLVPSTKGMSLAQFEDRRRISRVEAEQILREFLGAVAEANAEEGRRVFIERVFVFGSYLNASKSLGDIDLLLISDLPEDAEPEDWDDQDELFEQVKLSEFLSFHSEIDLVATNAEKLEIYSLD